MHLRLLDILCCPACGSSLTAEPFELNEARMIHGLLRCLCEAWFPVINGVPRLLLDDLRRELATVHREYYGVYSDRLPLEPWNTEKLSGSVQLRTQISFGYEWTEFPHYAVDNFSVFIEPLARGFFAGKFGLDVGCGAGRHVKHATSLGAEVIGVDLSHAVDSAALLNRDNPRAHFVQGDILRLPFLRNVFDFVYSLGVLHHLPNPEAGFHQLVQGLRSKGSIFIWVYQRTKRKEWLEHVRRVTTRLPLGALKTISWAAAALEYGIVVNLYRLFHWSSMVSRTTPGRIKEYAGYDFLSSYTDYFDRLSAPISHCYSQADVQGWFERAGLHAIDTALVGDSWVWGKGEHA